MELADKIVSDYTYIPIIIKSKKNVLPKTSFFSISRKFCFLELARLNYAIFSLIFGKWNMVPVYLKNNLFICSFTSIGIWHLE